MYDATDCVTPGCGHFQIVHHGAGSGGCSMPDCHCLEFTSRFQLTGGFVRDEDPQLAFDGAWL